MTILNPQRDRTSSKCFGCELAMADVRVSPTSDLWMVVGTSRTAPASRRNLATALATRPNSRSNSRTPHSVREITPPAKKPKS